MAFTVQTNPPTVDANAYITVAEFRAYHSDRGRDFTSFTDAKVQVAIVLATQYMDVAFEFGGYRVAADQTTEFPRQALYNCRNDRLVGIPRPVKFACAEYAMRALTSPLLPDPDRDTSGQFVKSKSETVGPISERVEYSEARGFVMPAYPLADKLLTSQCIATKVGQTFGLSSGDLGRS